MADGVNRVTLIGNLGDDPELRYSGSGTAICNMSVAVNETYKDSDGNKVENTEWIDVVTFGRLAEVCNEYLEKGQQVYFEGKLQTRSWDDNDGNTRYSTEVKAREMKFLSGGGDVPGEGGSSGGQRGGQQGRQQTSQQPSGSSQEQESFEPDDSLPF